MRRRRLLALALAPVLAAALAPAGLGPAAAGVVRYRIDPAASELTFHATSLLVNADGRFHRFGGEIAVDPDDLRTARVTLTIDVASIDTANARRDNHLRDEDFFHAERYPTATFESLRVDGSGGRLVVVGRLTLRGVTREIAVPVDVALTPARLEARGRFDLRRTDYGISYQSRLNPVGDVVRVAFLLRARPDAGA